MTAPRNNVTVEEDTAGVTSRPLPKRSPKDRANFVSVLRTLAYSRIPADSKILVIGGMQEDAEVLQQCGFSDITLSNIEGVGSDPRSPGRLPIIAIDAENIDLPDNAYDAVFVHEAIHHCRSPHRALCEMLRVAGCHVIMMEPNDSAVMRLLCRLGFSFPYELFAVVDNDYVCGGVRNSDVPNFIFRWSHHEVFKTASSFLAEWKFAVYSNPYWDFGVEERDLAYREQTRIKWITRLMGAKNFIRMLRIAQSLLNRIPVIRGQGNKFFCCVEKKDELRPWLERDVNGRVCFKRSFQRQLEP